MTKPKRRKGVFVPIQTARSAYGIEYVTPDSAIYGYTIRDLQALRAKDRDAYNKLIGNCIAMRKAEKMVIPTSSSFESQFIYKDQLNMFNHMWTVEDADGKCVDIDYFK